MAGERCDGVDVAEADEAEDLGDDLGVMGVLFVVPVRAGEAVMAVDDDALLGAPAERSGDPGVLPGVEGTEVDAALNAALNAAAYDTGTGAAEAGEAMLELGVPATAAPREACSGGVSRSGGAKAVQGAA
jgi:hypothetical protein